MFLDKRGYTLIELIVVLVLVGSQQVQANGGLRRDWFPGLDFEFLDDALH